MTASLSDYPQIDLKKSQREAEERKRIVESRKPEKIGVQLGQLYLFDEFEGGISKVSRSMTDPRHLNDAP